MIFQFWGATTEEIHGSVVGDNLCRNATLIATRSITLSAPPKDVFPWIQQMGFGRAGWYSYDWIDNLGRKSATKVHEEWQSVTSGDKIPAGPISFTAAIVEAPRHFVLEIKSLGKKSPKLHFTLAYELREGDQAGSAIHVSILMHHHRSSTRPDPPRGSQDPEMTVPRHH